MVPGDRSVAISTCCAGIIVLLPGIYLNKIEKSGETSKNIKTRTQIIAIPAAILAVLLALWITPENTWSWRSRTLATIVDDIGYLFRNPLGSWPDITPNFSMYDLGFQADKERLGGPANPGDGNVLDVESPVKVLLKSRVFDEYTGSSWEIGAPDGDFRYESILWRRHRREALGQDRPMGGNRTEDLYKELTREVEITITHMTSHYHALFTTGKIRSLEFSSKLVNPTAFFNMRSEIYMRERMPKQHGIILKTRIWRTSQADFDSLFLELETIAINEDDKRYETLLERYTALPEGLPNSVKEITSQITAGDTTPYNRVISMIAWLNENFEYSLEPDIVPENEDFVDYFFKTGVGYCTYFATALAVMARIEGIPSRYVTGFALTNKESGSGFIATGETAHAWTELYFKGIGWVEIDPLNWNPDVPLNRRVSDELQIEQPQITQPEHSSGNKDREDNPGDIVPIAQTEISYWPIIIILTILAAIIILPRMIISILLGRKSRQFSINRVCTRENDNFRRLEIYHIDIFRQLALIGMTPVPGETLITFPIRVDRRIKFNDISYSEIAKYVSDYHFAGIEPGQKQIREAYQYHQRIENLLFDELGKWAYLVKRAIR